MLTKLSDYPVELLEAGNDFLTERSKRNSERVRSIIVYLTDNPEYTEHFFDGFSTNSYFYEESYGPIKRWLYRRAFWHGWTFRLACHKYFLKKKP